MIFYKNLKDFFYLKEILIEIYNKIEELYFRKLYIIGVFIGFVEFDRMIVGF